MDFEGSQEQHSVLECHRELADTLRNVEGSRGKIPRANNFKESSRVLRGMSRVLRGMLRDVEGKSRELTNYHRVRGIIARREKLQRRKYTFPKCI